MTAATYGDMQTRIATELTRSDLTTQIQQAILSAIDHYKVQKFWFNEAVANSNCTSGVSTLAIPTDMLQLDKLELIYNNFPRTMVQRDWATILQFSINTSLLVGIPTDFAYYMDEWWLYPRPNQNFAMRAWYLKELPALSSSSDSNAWTTSCEELIRSRAKADIEANYLHKDYAVADQGRLSVQGFMCDRELGAYEQLMFANTQRVSSGGRLPPSTF